MNSSRKLNKARAGLREVILAEIETEIHAEIDKLWASMFGKDIRDTATVLVSTAMPGRYPFDVVDVDGVKDSLPRVSLINIGHIC